MSREDDLVLNLTKAMVGAITANVRMVSIEFRQPPRVRLHFLLEKESAGDREECEEISFNLAALSRHAVEVELNIQVSSKPSAKVNLPGRVVYGRKENPSLEERNRTAPIAENLSRWGVVNPVRLVERRPFQSWVGCASSWGGRLNDGRAVVIEVQDTWAELWLDYNGAAVLDLRARADALVNEVLHKAEPLHASLVPWLRVEHDAKERILLWIRESEEGERVGAPSGPVSPGPLLEWLQPVAEAVDWAKGTWSFGLCPNAEDLVWRGGRAAVVGWGKESFDRLVTSRNGELRLGLDPEIGAALREKRAPLPHIGWLSDRANMSVLGFVTLWLRLRLGKDQIWFEHQLDPLPPQERGVVMRWLSSKQPLGGAVDFVRELGRALT